MMPPSLFRTRLALAFVLVGSFLSACITTTTPMTRFYILNSLDSDTSLGGKTSLNGPFFVEVASIRLPQYLERPQLVTRSGGNRLELAEYHQWGGNLRKNMTRVLAKNLSHLLSTPNVSISPHRPPVSPDFLVDLEVMRFEKDMDGRVRLSTQWRLSRGKDRKPLVTQISDMASPPVPPSQDFDGTVAAMSVLFGELSLMIGQTIMEHDAR